MVKNPALQPETMQLAPARRPGSTHFGHAIGIFLSVPVGFLVTITSLVLLMDAASGGFWSAVVAAGLLTTWLSAIAVVAVASSIED